MNSLQASSLNTSLNVSLNRESDHRRQTLGFLRLVKSNASEYNRRMSAILLSEEDFTSISTNLVNLKLETQQELRKTLLKSHSEFQLLDIWQVSSSYQAISNVIRSFQSEYANDSEMEEVLRSIQAINKKCLDSIAQRLRSNLWSM